MDCIIGVPLALGTAWFCCVNAFPEGRIASSSKRVTPFDDIDDERPRRMTAHELEVYRAHMNIYCNQSD